MGPVISQAATDRIMGAITGAVQSGTGRLITGGSRIGGHSIGLLHRADRFRGRSQRQSPGPGETFGPVVSVMAFDDEDEAISIANDTYFGLVAYAHAPTSLAPIASRVACRPVRYGSTPTATSSRAAPTGVQAERVWATGRHRGPGRVLAGQEHTYHLQLPLVSDPRQSFAAPAATSQ